MKKIIIFLMIVIMIMGGSFTVMGTDGKNLDLESSVDMALKQNLELKIEELNLEKAKLQCEKQKANNLLNNSRYSELEAEYSLLTARNTYQNVYNNLVENTIQQYTGLCLSELDLVIKDKKVKLQKLLLTEAEAQYSIGDIGSIELLEQENVFKDAQFNLESSSDDYQQSIIELKTLLGIKEGDLLLNDISEPKIWEISEEKAVDTALNSSIDLKLKKEKLKLVRIDLERAEVSASELDKEIKKIDVEAAELEKNKMEEDIINSTQQEYYKFKQSVKNMKLKKERLREAREKYELRKKQYRAGLLTEADVLQYEVNMMEARYQYFSAIANYYLQQHSLRQAMNLKTGVFGNENTDEK